MRSPPSQVRRRGKAPYRLVVVHGGPGAPGSLAPVADVLARTAGVLEPWQTAQSVNGQVEELANQIERWATPPVTLIGHSWGAWLSILLAGQRPDLVRRLVLVGSGPFRARDALRIEARRKARLSRTEWSEFQRIGRRFSNPHARVPAGMMRRFGRLSERSDSFDLGPHRSAGPPPEPATFRKVWPEAEAMRNRGQLRRAVGRIRAPVLVLHGRDDPHPVEGVVDPLRRSGVKIRVVILDRCGHYPWWEHHARDAFFRALRAEVRRSGASSSR